MKQLEEESAKLERLVADLSLDKAMLQDVPSENALRPSRCRELIPDLMQRFGASERQTCALLKLSRTVYRYKSVARDESALEVRIKEVTEVRVHYGALCVYRDASPGRLERQPQEGGTRLSRTRAIVVAKAVAVR